MHPELEQYLRRKRMYRSSSKADRSERVAKLVAIFVTFGCVVFFILVARPEKQPLRKLSSVPVAAPVPEPPPPRTLDPNKQFLAVPGRWASVDFKHHNYGVYKFSDGRKISLSLKNGEYEYDFGDNDHGWFSLNAVYYFDVTGDEIPDAIIDVSHVECGGGSCDGGAHLLFIYSKNEEGKVKELFTFETGSYAYGCGLKSMILERQAVSLELFGRCPRPPMNYLGPGKFLVEDVTQFAFEFSHKGFIQTNMDYVSTGGFMDVRSHRPEIRITEDVNK